MDKIKKVKSPSLMKPGKELDAMNMSVGMTGANKYKATKTDGVKIRGTGAATKGVRARGPMA